MVDLAAPDGSGVLLFLCGRTLKEVARARLPHALPVGLRCAFYPAPAAELSLGASTAAPAPLKREPPGGAAAPAAL